MTSVALSPTQRFRMKRQCSPPCLHLNILGSFVQTSSVRDSWRTKTLMTAVWAGALGEATLGRCLGLSTRQLRGCRRRTPMAAATREERPATCPHKCALQQAASLPGVHSTSQRAVAEDLLWHQPGDTLLCVVGRCGKDSKPSCSVPHCQGGKICFTAYSYSLL
jgi:hypothetical protein